MPEAFKTATSQGQRQGQGGRVGHLTCLPSLPPPPSLLSICCVPDTVLGPGNTRWVRQTRSHSSGASDIRVGEKNYKQMHK